LTQYREAGFGKQNVGSGGWFARSARTSQRRERSEPQRRTRSRDIVAGTVIMQQ